MGLCRPLRRRHDLGIVVAAAATVALAAGCASNGASGGNGAAQPPGNEPPSSLFATSQLSAAGFEISAGSETNGPVVASASRPGTRRAPWYSTGDTPGLSVETSQDYRTGIITFGTGTSSVSDVALDADGSATVLMNVSPNASPGYFISGDGQWLVLIPGASVTDPVTQVYHLAGRQALPTTFALPPQVSASIQPGGTILGFTSSDDLLILNNEHALWEVSVEGKSARQLQSAYAGLGSGSYGSGIVDQVEGTPQAGMIAMEVNKYNQSGVPSFSTRLLSATGTPIHTFPDGSPLLFSPDGKYVLINQSTATSNPGSPAPEEACNVVTFACVTAPEQVQTQWLPNGDLPLGPDSWWDPETGATVGVPASFRLVAPNLILPTVMMNRVAATRVPQTTNTGGD